LKKTPNPVGKTPKRIAFAPNPARRETLLPEEAFTTRLPDAMSADAATVAPTKRRRRAWLIGLAVVVAVVTIALLANAPKQEPVKVWFVRATNEAGVKKLVFEGTNGAPRRILFSAGAYSGALDDTETPIRRRLYHNPTIAWPAAGTNFNFTVDTPSNDAPYFVMWSFHEIKSSRTGFERFQLWCEGFFRARGMPAVGRRLGIHLETHYIPSTEIKE